MLSSTRLEVDKGFSIFRNRFKLPDPRAFHSLALVKQNTSEGKEVAAKLQCVLDCCIYPKTCGWNKRCMEEGMRMSKDAKMVREQAIRRETDGDTKK